MWLWFRFGSILEERTGAAQSYGRAGARTSSWGILLVLVRVLILRRFK